MAKPERDDEDLGMGRAPAAPDDVDMSDVIFGANEHDALWIDALSDDSPGGGIDDWTQSPTGDARAPAATDGWLSANDGANADEANFEDGLALTTIDGLPW